LGLASTMVTRLCSRCVMPETYPDIRFDSEGVCNFCRGHKNSLPLGEQAFLDKISGLRGDAYDCVLGISGGKDSCYMAYLARKRCNLRALAVFYDFPFLCDLARDNARRVCDTLGIELIFVRTSNNLEYELLRNHLISLAGTGVTWGQCMFCHYGIDGVLFNMACDRNIPFILSGVTASEVWWNPGNRTSILMRRVRKLPPKELGRLAYHQFRAYCQLVDQRRQFNIPMNNPLSAYSRPKLPVDGPEVVKVFDYFAWNQHEIEHVLNTETGWVKPGKKLTWRYDCILEPLLDFTYLREFAVSTVGLYVSGLVRSGLLSRAEAMEMRAEAENPEVMHNNVKLVFDYLRLPQSVQDAYLHPGLPSLAVLLGTQQNAQ
jgi:hypothetical protein